MHTFCKTYNASNLCKGRSIIRPEFSMSLRSMFKVYAVLKFKNNILINSESLLKESYYHTQMQSLQVNSCTSQSEVFFIIECFRGDIIKYCLTN